MMVQVQDVSDEGRERVRMREWSCGAVEECNTSTGTVRLPWSSERPGVLLCL